MTAKQNTNNKHLNFDSKKYRRKIAELAPLIVYKCSNFSQILDLTSQHYIRRFQREKIQY